MKVLKITLILMLGALFLLSGCAGLQTKTSDPAPNRQLHEPESITSSNAPPVDFYTHYNCWKSPFNPHDVIQYWTKLGHRQINQVTMVVMLGNPTIDWKKALENTVGVPVPKGEIAAIIVCVFVRTQVGIELAAYGYTDNLGVRHTFRLDMETKCYKKHLIPTQQDSCVTNYLKATFSTSPTNK